VPSAMTPDTPDSRRLLGNAIIGAVFMMLVGSALHFVYGWSNHNALVGLLAPVNESIWEHAKLVFLPPLLWYKVTALSARRRRSYEVFGASAVALWFMPPFQIAFFYAYTAVTGSDLFVMDLVDFALTVILGQVLFYRLATRLHCTRAGRVAAVISVVVLAALFVTFTLWPPHFPLFMDPDTGVYGVPRP
jgi:hypothetical protein